ncbi:hypothetical protein BHE74_00036138 [Ensete ventricosum]|uniref:Uncharacterized protein n=1 Tax=Ensete ventricosum TaxID=4639 RepID=A0A445MIC9_ENSVE|nr:hypothetical protein BHE74_00036138 [Ensete ventricosum]RZR74027.1 hypothetical protein BHM03_00031297 [Ensete ventricosum]
MMGRSQVRVSDRGLDDVVRACREFARSSLKVIGKLVGSTPGVHWKMTEKLVGSLSEDARKITGTFIG